MRDPDLTGSDDAFEPVPRGRAPVFRRRKHREDQYEKLLDAVYKRRGWTPNGVPTLEKLKDLGIDFPWLVEVVEPHLEG